MKTIILFLLLTASVGAQESYIRKEHDRLRKRVDSLWQILDSLKGASRVGKAEGNGYTRLRSERPYGLIDPCIIDTGWSVTKKQIDSVWRWGSILPSAYTNHRDTTFQLPYPMDAFVVTVTFIPITNKPGYSDVEKCWKWVNHGDMETLEYICPVDTTGWSNTVVLQWEPR